MHTELAGEKKSRFVRGFVCAGLMEFRRRKIG
jgi:hypothetical protein